MTWLIGYIIVSSILSNAVMLWVINKLLNAQNKPSRYLIDRHKENELERERDNYKRMYEEAVRGNTELAKLQIRITINSKY